LLHCSDAREGVPDQLRKGVVLWYRVNMLNLMLLIYWCS